jgi:AcrR family transcriptional regulator
LNDDAVSGGGFLVVKSAVAPGEEALSHNLLGQRLGRKGRDTRARILAATERVLSEPEGAFTLSAVAREAGLRITSLYLYFNDLSELLGAVLEPVMASAEAAYVAQVREPWPDEALSARCQSFVAAYHRFWLRNTRVLHLRNTYADAGDQLMWRYRLSASRLLNRLLVAQMEADSETGDAPANFLSSTLLIGLERMATTATDPRFPELMTAGNPLRKGPVDLEAQVAGLVTAEAKIFELTIAHARAAARKTA